MCIQAPRCPAGSQTVEKGPLGAWLLGPANDPDPMTLARRHAAGQQPWLQEADRVEILAPPRTGQVKEKKPLYLLRRQEQRQSPRAPCAHSHLPKPSKELRPPHSQRGLPHRTGGTTSGERSGRCGESPASGPGRQGQIWAAARSRLGCADRAEHALGTPLLTPVMRLRHGRAPLCRSLLLHLGSRWVAVGGAGPGFLESDSFY